MREDLVWIGSYYEVVQGFGKYFKTGEILKACMYGSLFLEKEDKVTGFYYNPSKMVKYIKEGKIKRLD